MVFALSFLIISYLQVLSSKFIKSNHCYFSIYSFHAFLFCKWVESAPVSKKFDCMIEDRWKCQNCGNSVPDGLTVCPKCGLVKGGFDELPKHTADGLEIARVEQKVKVEIPFILYLGTVCSIILLAIVVYIYVAIKL